MEVLPMQVFVSLLLVVGALVLLAYSVKQADHEHADRLSLLPIESGETTTVPGEGGGDAGDPASSTTSKNDPQSGAAANRLNRSPAINDIG